MSKQQTNAFKGRVKRLLHAQKDMGQVSEPALQACGASQVCSHACNRLVKVLTTWTFIALVGKLVAAIEAFVHDVGRKLAAQAATQQQDEQQDEQQSESTSNAIVTPVQLKHVVLADPTLAFLHKKVESIDESDAKYHRKQKKAPTRKAPAATATATATNKKRTAAAADKSSASAAKKSRTMKAKTSAAAVAVPSTTVQSQPVLAIEEDDDYDESDSE